MMITLTNGHPVRAAYLLPAQPGMKPHGIVLSETPTDWVTWNVYHDTEREPEGSTRWEAESGHYYTKAYPAQQDAKVAAEIDFGKRLQRLLSANIEAGFQAHVA